jgi:hypothetical protein
MSRVDYRLTFPANSTVRPIPNPGELFERVREEWGEGADGNRRAVALSNLKIDDETMISVRIFILISVANSDP